ncbi:hybrid sensor histidine kinase/response regulator [Noviherbaspirillum galbum]|uniref:histidine kinase n=1 Tax=Noviherbaspirillum galbum TaxID=2709383 RepID=A0A6B3STB1_9BURK|nr:ATP-binding protein [Noviherbaspirillum galbum]NEX62575.1 PAS domain-containing protein [Noviherbaspirillum galbum]
MNDKKHSATPLRFLSDGGHVGALMRELDWTSSPLGHPADWPPALRTAVGMMIHSNFPMFVAWGPDLGFLYNDAYSEILGEKHPAALGRRFYDIWSEIWHDINPLIERAMSGQSSFRENLPLLMHRHGYDEATWFTFAYSPLHDENGDVAGMYCTCVETTKQVLAEKYRNEENERFRTLFEQAPGFMAILRGPEHFFDLTNGAYQQLVGHRSVLGKSAREALPEVVDQGFIRLLDRVYDTGEPFVGRAVAIKLQRERDGPLEERFLDFVYQPIRDAQGAVTGIFAEGSDVTERKQAEDDLRNANRQKDEFLAMLAHELRNPLAPITTAAELLRLGHLDAKGLQNASAIISRQAEHMTALVDDLLDMSRVTRGLITLDQEELDINAVVTSAVEQVRGLIDSRRHWLTLQLSGEPAHVMGDRTRLVQVFSNILNNAAKYTPPKGEITLRVEVDSGNVEVTVRDNGTGIAPEVLPHIFDLFAQADRTLARSQGGLGIGLSLVKSLVALHGGSVLAESEGVEMGSRFTVRLPRLAEAEPARAADHDATPRPAGSLRILLVDDNVDATQMLSMLLQAAGHQVVVEHDAGGALRRLQQERPDALLLDIGLPDMDGYALAGRVRALPGMGHVMLVALTGYGQNQDRQRSADAGFDHHLVKPANMEQLAGILNKAGKVPPPAPE